MHCVHIVISAENLCGHRCLKMQYCAPKHFQARCLCSRWVQWVQLAMVGCRVVEGFPLLVGGQETPLPPRSLLLLQTPG